MGLSPPARVPVDTSARSRRRLIGTWGSSPRRMEPGDRTYLQVALGKTPGNKSPEPTMGRTQPGYAIIASGGRQCRRQRGWTARKYTPPPLHRHPALTTTCRTFLGVHLSSLPRGCGPGPGNILAPTERATRRHRKSPGGRDSRRIHDPQAAASAAGRWAPNALARHSCELGLAISLANSGGMSHA